MDLNIYYNNKVLSAQEREGFRIISEETIRDFSESIEGFMSCHKNSNLPKIKNMTK